MLLSIPHGGKKKPPELEHQVCITDRDLFDDSDPFTIEIYDLGEKVQKIIKTDIARAFVDLNRSLQDLPPKNPDGLIKSATCYQKPIYYSGKEPDDSMIDNLIQSHYMPYHREIQKSLHQYDLQLCIDCHSMASTAPNVSPDGNNKKRPMFCLSNQDGNTSSSQMIDLLADCISECFSLDRNEIKLNDPFHGGYITRTYGNNPIPWIQVEMNREMYLTEPWFSKDTMSVDVTHTEKLKKQFENSLELLFSKYLLH